VLRDRLRNLPRRRPIASVGEPCNLLGELGRNPARDCDSRRRVYIVHVLKLVRLGSAIDLSRTKVGQGFKGAANVEEVIQPRYSRFVGRKPVPINRAAICASCDWTNYPHPVPIAERSGLVEWKTPATCERCGKPLSVAAIAAAPLGRAVIGG
jgi:hypothetical protein